MVTNKIILKIQEESEHETAALLAAAKSKAAASAARINEAAVAKVKDLNAQAQADAAEAARRQLLIAELEARKNALDKQRELVEEVFDQAKQALQNLPQDKWELLIEKTVVKASETGSEKLCVPASDLKKYENGFLERLNEALRKAGKRGELTLAEECASFSGGVMLIGADSDFDASFETLLREVRGKSEREVAKLLFGSEVN